jgi:hypothetical protein
MMVGRLRELLANIPAGTEIIMWDADLEDHRILAIRISDDDTEAVQLLTEGV